MPTRRKAYRKLVRDLIPRIIMRDGGTPETRTLSAAGFKNALLDKLVEEAAEVQSASGLAELMTELADVQEVCLAIMTAHGINPKELERLRKRRARERGAFEKKIFLESVKMKK